MKRSVVGNSPPQKKEFKKIVENCKRVWGNKSMVCVLRTGEE